MYAVDAPLNVIFSKALKHPIQRNYCRNEDRDGEALHRDHGWYISRDMSALPKAHKQLCKIIVVERCLDFIWFVVVFFFLHWFSDAIRSELHDSCT